MIETGYIRHNPVLGIKTDQVAVLLRNMQYYPDFVYKYWEINTFQAIINMLPYGLSTNLCSPLEIKKYYTPSWIM